MVRWRSINCTSALFLALTLGTSLRSADPGGRPPRKVALLVGVNRYDHAFEDLKFAERDVEKLASALRPAGFEVAVLTGSATEKADRATGANIRDRLKALLRGKDDAIRKGDIVLVALNGHGVQTEVTDKGGGQREEPFFCPADAIVNDPETMIGLSDLVNKTLAPYGARTLVLVDACRNDPDPTRGRGIEGRQITLPPNTAILFSCGRGQRSYEHDKADDGHGLFTCAVLRGLGGAAGAKDGTVTWARLVAYVQEELEAGELKALLPSGRNQTPVPAVGQLEHTVLLAARTSAKSDVGIPPTRPDVQPQRGPFFGTTQASDGPTLGLRDLTFTRNDELLVGLSRGNGESEQTPPDDPNSTRPELVVWDAQTGKLLNRWTIRSGVA